MGDMPFPSQKGPAHEHRHFLVNGSSLLPATATGVASDSSLPPETPLRFAQCLAVGLTVRYCRERELTAL